MESNKYTELNSDDIYIQKLFVIYMINQKNIWDNPTINKYFTDYFGSNLSLSNSVLSKIKNKFFDEYKDLDLIQLLEKVKLNIPNLFINIYDVEYEIKIKNKRNIRNNRIIFFGIKENLKLLNYNETNEIFCNTTFVIIPFTFRL